MNRRKRNPYYKEGDKIDDDDMEYFRACEAFKKKYHLTFLSMTEQLAILKSLGYQKGKDSWHRTTHCW